MNKQFVVVSIMAIVAMVAVLFNMGTVSATSVDLPAAVQPASSDSPDPAPKSELPDPTKPNDQIETMTCDEAQCAQHCAALGHCDIGCDIHGVCRCDNGPPC